LQVRRQPFSRFALVLHRHKNVSLEQTAVIVALVKRCSQRPELALVETAQVIADVLDMLFAAYDHAAMQLTLPRQLARNRVLYLLGPALLKALYVHRAVRAAPDVCAVGLPLVLTSCLAPQAPRSVVGYARCALGGTCGPCCSGCSPVLLMPWGCP